MKKRTAIYPGSFDPPTNGHLDIVDRALAIFDRIIVAVIANPAKKKTLFTSGERLDMLNDIFKENGDVEVDRFEGLLVDYARIKEVSTVIRGLRAVSDFEYEFQMALMNRRLSPGMQSVYLMPAPEHTYLSSSLIKEVYGLGGDVTSFIPAQVIPYLERKIDRKP